MVDTATVSPPTEPAYLNLTSPQKNIVMVPHPTIIIMTEELLDLKLMEGTLRVEMDMRITKNRWMDNHHSHSNSIESLKFCFNFYPSLFYFYLN